MYCTSSTKISFDDGTSWISYSSDFVHGTSIDQKFDMIIKNLKQDYFVLACLFSIIIDIVAVRNNAKIMFSSTLMVKKYRILLVS